MISYFSGRILVGFRILRRRTGKNSHTNLGRQSGLIALPPMQRLLSCPPLVSNCRINLSILAGGVSPIHPTCYLTLTLQKFLYCYYSAFSTLMSDIIFGWWISLHRVAWITCNTWNDIMVKTEDMVKNFLFCIVKLIVP